MRYIPGVNQPPEQYRPPLHHPASGNQPPPPQYPPQQAPQYAPTPQSPHAQQQSQPQSGQGQIVLMLQGSVMTSNMIAPKVFLNGYEMPSHYGENHYPMPAGPVRIDIYCQWWRKYGRAQLDTGVQPGGVTPVYYAAPLHMFTSGSIGYEKQPRKGLVGLIALLVLVTALVALPIVFALI